MKSLLVSLALCLMAFISTNLFAKTITLYDQPNATAKTIGTIDSEKGLIPIFTPKDGQWVKIANPLDGTVGWAKASDLKIENKNGYTISEQVISQGKGPQSFIIKFGETKPLTDAEKAELTKKMQERQQLFQKNMQHILQDISTQFNDISTHFPVIMPIVLVPEQSTKTTSKPETKATTGTDKK
jgi:hypothetical protein